MRKLTGIILSLFLLCSTFAPSLAFAAENFDSNKIGWVQEGNEKYYFDKPGVKHTGWLELEGKNYYIDSSGKSLFSYQIINGKTHYLDDSGTARTGWIQ
ncbi:hypothetical protein QUF88_17750 [Bacillus sp. DX1.1]|uniref:hypothetical protein n=1 Tax=unclassified Bacillus (in: firmicutes) TaxID=185979 RepID=UPI00256FFF6A|nr:MULTISPECIES: hypothetical protein [unclassified Bacillus (in: firmicutes)]MDM5155569.1 hypothetical protein [Bacillus sp. DX1.1]WJE79877.1 hypothetical protein QRE67_15275 [Bacillus sp. DX3.1]